MKHALAVMAVIALTTPTMGHEKWKNGEAIDKQTKQFCCSEADCHDLEDWRVHYNPDGTVTLDLRGAWQGRGQPVYSPSAPTDLVTIPSEREMPSPDGYYWVCYWGGEVKCFFGPLKGY